MRRLLVCTFAALAFVSPAFAQEEKTLRVGGFVPSDAPVFVTVRPAALLKLKDVKALYDRVAQSEEIKRIVDVAEPESVDEITFVLLRRTLKLEGDPHEALARDSAVIVRTNKTREWKALAAAAHVPVAKVTHGGKEYFRVSGDTPIGFGFLPLDEMTMVVASESNLKQIVDTNKGAGPALIPSTTTPGAQTVAVASVDLDWVRSLVGPAIASETGATLALAVVKPVWEKTNRVVVWIEAGDAEGLTLVADHSCNDEDGAKLVQATAEALLTLAQNVAPDALKVMRKEAQGNPAATEAADLAEQALKSASVERTGSRVRVKATVKLDVAKLARLAGVQ